MKESEDNDFNRVPLKTKIVSFQNCLFRIIDSYLHHSDHLPDLRFYMILDVFFKISVLLVLRYISTQISFFSFLPSGLLHSDCLLSPFRFNCIFFISTVLYNKNLNLFILFVLLFSRLYMSG